jgi:hypothetical protein
MPLRSIEPRALAPHGFECSACAFRIYAGRRLIGIETTRCDRVDCLVGVVCQKIDDLMQCGQRRVRQDAVFGCLRSGFGKHGERGNVGGANDPDIEYRALRLGLSP